MCGTYASIGLFILLLALVSTPAVAGEMDALFARKKKPATPAVNTDTNALLRQTVWRGEVSSAPTNSAPGVCAALKTGNRRSTATFLLRADDPVLIARLQEMTLSRQGAQVVLTARLNPDCATLLVTEVFVTPKAQKPERR